MEFCVSKNTHAKILLLFVKYTDGTALYGISLDCKLEAIGSRNNVVPWELYFFFCYWTSRVPKHLAWNWNPSK